MVNLDIPITSNLRPSKNEYAYMTIVDFVCQSLGSLIRRIRWAMNKRTSKGHRIKGQPGTPPATPKAEAEVYLFMVCQSYYSMPGW